MNYSQYISFEIIYLIVGIGLSMVSFLIYRGVTASRVVVNVGSNASIPLKTKSENLSQILSESEFSIGLSHGTDFNLEYDDFRKFCLILGTTGSGKTVTIKNIFSAFNQREFPIIYVDGKPSDGLINFLHETGGERFKGFNCHNNCSYDFLRGSASEIMDRIICIKDEWESDYYKTLSSDYVQLVLKYLIETGESFTLQSILDNMNITKFLSALRNAKSPLIEQAIYFADNIKSNELKGLYSHMSLVLNSDFGQFLVKHNERSIVLEDVIRNNEIAYFALPALKFPEFASFIGKVVINDIKATIERVRKPVLIVFDEFSVFVGGQVLNLINQGREYGAHTIVGTQSLEDLGDWSDQILNNANLLMSHRVHSNNTAESVSKFFGTRKQVQITRQLSDDVVGAAGSARSTREFFIHPDELKTLGVGECAINIKDKSLIRKVNIHNL